MKRFVLVGKHFIIAVTIFVCVIIMVYYQKENEDMKSLYEYFRNIRGCDKCVVVTLEKYNGKQQMERIIKGWKMLKEGNHKQIKMEDKKNKREDLDEFDIQTEDNGKVVMTSKELSGNKSDSVFLADLLNYVIDDPQIFRVIYTYEFPTIYVVLNVLQGCLLSKINQENIDYLYLEAMLVKTQGLCKIDMSNKFLAYRKFRNYMVYEYDKYSINAQYRINFVKMSKRRISYSDEAKEKMNAYENQNVYFSIVEREEYDKLASK